jgi:virginiamycin B lyase
VACAFAMSAAALCLGPATAQAAFPITEYATTAGASPWAMTLGPDGNVWFTEESANAIGRVTPGGVVKEFAIPTAASNPQGITAGPDGALWFTEASGNKIGRITTAGTFKEFTIPIAGSAPLGITTGPDGRLWFAEHNANRIGRVTTGGTFASFPTPTKGSAPYGITAGPDGNLWFTEQARGRVGKITTGGVITEYPTGVVQSLPEEIAPGSDGNVWFTDPGTNMVGKATPSGTVTEYLVPTAVALPFGIAPGPDGDLWYAETDKDKIGQLTTAGSTISESTTPTAGSEPLGVSPGADGNIWLAESTGSNVAKLALPHLNILNVYYIPNRFFIPNIARLGQQGEAVDWLMLSPGRRGITDATGIGLYGTSPTGGFARTAIGGVFSFTFRWAGMYPYADPFHTASKGRVSVPIGVTQVVGAVGTAQVTWASGDAPAGCVFDVEVKVPGSNSFVPWRTDTTELSGTLGPSDPLWAGQGTYRFQARLRQVATGATSGYSSPKAIILV